MTVRLTALEFIRQGLVSSALGAIVIASVLSGTAWAQQGSVKFSGRVVDQVSGVLQNATLLMTGPSNTRGVTTSDDRGRFEFNLPPGQWSLDVYASGFSRQAEKITLEPRKNLSQDIRLIVGTATLATSGTPLRATEQSLESDLISRPRLTYPDSQIRPGERNGAC